MSNTPRRVSYKKQELITFRENIGSANILIGYVLLIFLVFSVVHVLCFVFYLFCMSLSSLLLGLL
jgi:hypothetical protein